MSKPGTPRPRTPDQQFLHEVRAQNPAYELYRKMSRDEWKRREMAEGRADSLAKAERLAIAEDKIVEALWIEDNVPAHVRRSKP